MNLELTAEQVALRDTVRSFLAEKAPISGHVRELLDDPKGATGPIWRGLAELGVTGLLVGRDRGGAGATMVEAGIVAEELGAALHPGPWLSTAVAAARALTRAGAAGAADAISAGIADGSIIAAVGPLGLDDANVVAARRGTGIALTGRVEVADAAAADVLLVFVHDRGTTGLFVVRTQSAGVSVTQVDGVDLTRKHFSVEMDDAAAQWVAGPSPKTVAAVIDDVHIATAADALGAASAVMRLAIEYAKTRTQFGHPIGSFQAIQHLCVDMYETVELARSGVMHALWAADHADDDERHLAAVRAKAFSGRLACVGDTAIQILGGIGYTWEHDAHLYLRRLLSWSALLGSPDGYLVEVGRSMLHDARARERR